LGWWDERNPRKFRLIDPGSHTVTEGTRNLLGNPGGALQVKYMEAELIDKRGQ